MVTSKGGRGPPLLCFRLHLLNLPYCFLCVYYIYLIYYNTDISQTEYAYSAVEKHKAKSNILIVPEFSPNLSMLV